MQAPRRELVPKQSCLSEGTPNSVTLEVCYVCRKTRLRWMTCSRHSR